MSTPLAIAVVGDFLPSSPTHHATNEALRHAAEHLAVDLEYVWVATRQLERRGPEASRAIRRDLGRSR